MTYKKRGRSEGRVEWGAREKGTKSRRECGGGTVGGVGGLHIKVVSGGERLGTALQEGIVHSPKGILLRVPRWGAAFLVCHVLYGPFRFRSSPTVYTLSTLLPIELTSFIQYIVHLFTSLDQKHPFWNPRTINMTRLLVKDYSYAFYYHAIHSFLLTDLSPSLH